MIDAIKLFKNSSEFTKEYINGLHDYKVECIRANPKVNNDWAFVAFFTRSPNRSTIDLLIPGS